MDAVDIFEISGIILGLAVILIEMIGYAQRKLRKYGNNQQTIWSFFKRGR